MTAQRKTLKLKAFTEDTPERPTPAHVWVNGYNKRKGYWRLDPHRNKTKTKTPIKPKGATHVTIRVTKGQAKYLTRWCSDMVKSHHQALLSDIDDLTATQEHIKVIKELKALQKDLNA